MPEKIGDRNAGRGNPYEKLLHEAGVDMASTYKVHSATTDPASSQYYFMARWTSQRIERPLTGTDGESEIYFFNTIGAPTRSRFICKGYIDELREQYIRAVPSSAIRTSISAVANMVFSRAHGSKTASDRALAEYGRTLRIIQEDKSIRSGKPSDCTLLSVALLGFFEVSL